DVRPRRVDRFLHHIAELAGRLEAALTGQHHGFEAQLLAPHFRPSQTSDHTDLVLALHFAEAVAANAGIVAQIGRGDLDSLDLLGADLLHGFAGQVGDLALQVAHASLAAVVADQVAQTFIGDLPLAVL